MPSPSGLDRVLTCPNLPSLPAVAMEVLELTRQADVPIRKIADTVRNDQALAAKILKTVNSSFYALSKPCSSISQAITYLGLNTVKSLVLGFSLVDAIQTPAASAFDFTSYWRRSIYGAAGARLIAMQTRACDAEEAFLSALLQDIGSLASYLAFGPKYLEAIAPAAGDHEKSSAAERALLEFDHTEAGARLAEKWRLPPELVAGIRFHHVPDSGPPQHSGLVRCVHLAALALTCLDGGNDQSKNDRFGKRANQWFRISQAQCPEILQAIASGAGELSRLFQLDTGRAPDISNLMAEAEEAKLEHQLSVERESSSLRESNERLQTQTITDRLTGAFNRGHFDVTLASAFTTAKSQGSSLTVFFSDADKFKSVNDSLGHQAGDAVLVELSKRFREMLAKRPGAVFCRYGGEEFACILPNCDRSQAATLAEELRAGVAATPFDLSAAVGSPKLHPVTISIGVATWDPKVAAILPDTESLLKAADRGVYAAKHAGRNCVRVFTPRVLSAAVPAPGTNPPDQATLRTAPNQGTTPGGPRIMVVDDDPAMLSLLSAALKKHNSEPLALSSVSDAREAMARVERRNDPKPHLVFCDLKLGDGTGLDILKAMRNSAMFGTTPFIMLSASMERTDREASLAAGANAFITKASLGADPGAALGQVVQFWTRFAA